MSAFSTAIATIDFSFVQHHGQGRKRTTDFSRAYRPIQAGDWLAWRYRGTTSHQLTYSYYWQVTAGPLDSLLLLTPWASNPVVLTQDLANELCFTETSRRLPFAAYAEVAQWFAGCHWALKLVGEEEEDMAMLLERFGRPRGGILCEPLPAEVLNDSVALRAYLLNTLYQLTHPGQYERRPKEAKQLSEAELTKFIREVSRRAASALIS